MLPLLPLPFSVTCVPRSCGHIPCQIRALLALVCIRASKYLQKVSFRVFYHRRKCTLGVNNTDTSQTKFGFMQSIELSYHNNLVLRIASSNFSQTTRLCEGIKTVKVSLFLSPPSPSLTFLLIFPHTIFAFSQQNCITITHPYTTYMTGMLFFCGCSTQQDSFIAYKVSART